MFKKIIKFIIHHKIISGIILLAILGSGYWAYSAFIKKEADIVYTLTRVEKGTIITSISGSGQISAFNQSESGRFVATIGQSRRPKICS